MRAGAVFFIAALVWLLLGTAAAFFNPLSLVWFLSIVCLLPFLIADGLFLVLLSGKLETERTISASLTQGISHQVVLRIRKSGKGFLPFRILLFDLYPPSMKCAVFPALLDRGQLQQYGELKFEYPILPLERGGWQFQGLELLFSSPLRFWKCRISLPCLSQGRIYPDFNKIKASAGDIRGILERTGLKNIRKRGHGMEFMSLREFQEGDSVRAIDWRATGRNRQSDGRQKVIVREYQEEQDQQVLILLDTGYRLYRREGEFALQFDSALGAMLLLAYVALKHGDSIAAGAFGNTELWLPPRKGLRSFPVLINGLYDLQSAPVPSSPFSALEDALKRLRRRTFIILISNFREEDGESLSWILKRIEKRHLLLLVSLREQEAEDIARRQPATPDEGLETAAAFSYLSSRRRLYQSWEHSGLLTLETSSAHLSGTLINRYLEVKRSGKL
ncbi:MAG: DUF58 domain-containing protein [Treponema sp.]|jgi:uncharacterized protein (DUF58 family)|nr:DUF58 domain-containing protein [Treponema sp.]